MKHYNTILVGLDVFEPCEAIIKQAEALHQKFDATLHFVYVLPIMIASIPYAYDAQTQIKEDSDKKLAEITQKFGLDKKHCHSRYGNPKDEISICAQDIGADLILVGSHGKHGLDLMLGSTANGVLHTAKCDVLTIRVDNDSKHVCSNDYKNITVAADLDRDNDQILAQARVMAAEYGAQVHLINVVPFTTTTAVAYYPNIDNELKGKAEEKLHIIAQNVDIPVKNTHVTIGVPRTEIVSLADQTKSELIVIGSHGRGAFASAVLGSTANAVLHAANQDILVVRIQD